MRQESRFNVRAKSRSGARGLMQLMPATASFIGRKRYRGGRRALLYQPELNIELGQKYIRHLIQQEQINGDLALAAAAYNGGPGNLAKWLKRARRWRYNDQLVFIETIPSTETRNYVKRVLANIWVYRHRLGQPAPSPRQSCRRKRPVLQSPGRQTGRDSKTCTELTTKFPSSPSTSR